MKELKGTKTEKNLQEAFAGESMARNKYTYWASKAKKDGFVQIAAIFEETAANEKEHAKMWFKLLEGGGIKRQRKEGACILKGQRRHLAVFKLRSHRYRQESSRSMSGMRSSSGLLPGKARKLLKQRA